MEKRFLILLFLSAFFPMMSSAQTVEKVKITFTNPSNGSVRSVVAGMSGINISIVRGTASSSYLEPTVTANNGYYDGSSIVVTNENGDQVTVCQSNYGFQWESGSSTAHSGAFSLRLKDAIYTAGTYTLTIPEGFFYTNKEHTAISAAVTTTFILAGWEFTDPAPFSVSNNVTVEELSTLTLTCTYPFHASTGKKPSSIVLYKLGSLGGMEKVTTVESITWNGEADKNGDYTSCTLTLADKMTEDATYTLVMPSGYFNILNIEFDATWKVVHPVDEDLTVTISPADGDKVDEIYDNVSLTCAAGISLSQEVHYSKIVIKDETGNEVAACKTADPTYAAGTGEETSDPTGYTLTFNTLVSALTGYNAGDKLTLCVPDSVFILGIYYTYNEEMNATYTLVSDDETLELSFSPKAGEVTGLRRITVSYSGGLLAGANANPSDISLTSEDGTVMHATTCSPVESTLNDNNDYTAYLITFDEAITDDGTYVLSIPEGYFTLAIGGGGSYYASDETTAAYTVKHEEIIYSIEVTPSDGETLASLANVRFAHTPIYLMTDEKNITVTDAFGTVVATGVTGSYDDDTNIEFDDDLNVTAITIPLTEEITTDGTYTVAVPADAFCLDANKTVAYAEAINVTVTVDGTTGINAVYTTGQEGKEIYNIAGQRLNAPLRGEVNIIRKTDGTVRKIITK